MALEDYSPTDWSGTHYADRGLPIVRYSGNSGLSSTMSIGDWFKNSIDAATTYDDDGNLVWFDNEEGRWRRPSETHWQAYQDYVYDKQQNDSGHLGNYDSAKRIYGQGYMPWNWENVEEGLSNRSPYNLNSLYGGSQYQNNRVTDWRHLGSGEYDSTRLASNTRNYLWNIHNDLLSKGINPGFNPDTAALELYQKFTGGNSPYGYGPNANPLLIREAVMNSYLNQPEVAALLGGYKPSDDAASRIQAYQQVRNGGIPVFNTFEQQGHSSDMFGNLLLGAALATISGGLAGPLAGALGGGTLGTLGAGAMVGGGLSALTGVDPLKGAITGGLGAGLNLALPEAGITDPTALAAMRSGLTAAATGGDPMQAALMAAINSGANRIGGAIGNNFTVMANNGDFGPSNMSVTLDGDDYSADAENQDGGFYGVPSGYEGLGYSAKDISQLIDGTYSGPEQSQAQVQEQMGDLYDTAYPTYPTSSSGYEGLGYSAQDIYKLMNGTYDGPEQGVDQVREQMGDDLFKLAYPTGALPATRPSSFNLKNAISGGSGLDYGNTVNKIQNIWAEGAKPKYDSPMKPYLNPALLSTGSPMQSSDKGYGQIIGELASVLRGRGYAVGGEVEPAEYVPGPEGRLYARHEERSFPVSGPGTGQSDDIPTMLADGEYVWDSDIVSALGDGSTKAGSEILDQFREEVRKHKRSAPPDKIPPKAKSPLEYLKLAEKRQKGSKHG